MPINQTLMEKKHSINILQFILHTIKEYIMGVKTLLMNKIILNQTDIIQQTYMCNEIPV